MNQGSNPTQDTYLPAGMPRPAYQPGGLDAPFWDAAQRGELVVQHCPSCGEDQWEPEWLCRACQSSDLTWRPVAPRGRVYSWVRAWHPVHPALRERGTPYLVVLVQLEEAPTVRMIGNLLGDPHEDVTIGQEVRAMFEAHASPEEPYRLVQWAVDR